MLLGDIDAIATLAVKDLDKAKEFYEKTLGMRPAGDNEPGTIAYKCGAATILVYESKFAGTNKATAATWAVRDLDSMVRALKSRGVVFEHYDFPGVTREGDIHIAGRMKNAWLKDPDGNILAIVNRLGG
jgi:catechol 2,3-dioxygenase-like lactoylglutathione lyase family enzyme